MTGLPDRSGRREAPEGGRVRRRKVSFLTRMKWQVVAALTAIAGVLLVVTALGILYAVALVPQLPAMREVRNPEIDLATIVYAANGTEIARFYRENRTWVTYDSIAPVVVEALIATEDHRFYSHRGIDFRRMFTSAYWTARGERQGGSTLTMQLARNLYPGIARSWPLERKLKEMMTSVKIERHYTKPEIIEMYLNTVAYGYNAFGIEAAARTYYNTKASDLDLNQAATLVGMLKGPSRYNPVRNPEVTAERRNVVLDRMVAHAGLSRAEAADLKGEPLNLSFRTTVKPGIAPHFAEYVRQWLTEWGDRYGYDVYGDGLRVYTTLDVDLQRAAVAAVREQGARLQGVANGEWNGFQRFWNTRADIVDGYIRDTHAYNLLRSTGHSRTQSVAALRGDAGFMDSLKHAHTRLETGLVAIDPNSGYVQAWVGGRDFERDQFDKVALARRQPGSAFKPFVYAAALDLGFGPWTEIADSAYTIQLAGSRRTWTPGNASGRYSNRMISLRDGLAYSVNSVTTRLVQEVGADRVADYAHRCGITSPLDAVPSIGLGTSEVTLLEMVSAYSTIATHGLYREPVVVSRIEDQEGNVLATFEPETSSGLSAYTAYTLLDMMRGVVNRGTGIGLRSRWHLTGDIAGKTGTTQNNADGWFIAMTPNLVAGSWVGFNDRRISFRSRYWGSGGHNALEVVGSFLRRARRGGYDLSGRFVPPPGWIEPMPPNDSLQFVNAELGQDSIPAWLPEFEAWYDSLRREIVGDSAVTTDSVYGLHSGLRTVEHHVDPAYPEAGTSRDTTRASERNGRDTSREQSIDYRSSGGEAENAVNGRAGAGGRMNDSLPPPARNEATPDTTRF